MLANTAFNLQQKTCCIWHLSGHHLFIVNPFANSDVMLCVMGIAVIDTMQLGIRTTLVAPKLRLHKCLIRHCLQLNGFRAG